MEDSKISLVGSQLPTNIDTPRQSSDVGTQDDNESVRALDWMRCTHIDPTGQQCDKWIRVTPSERHLCAAHNPAAKRQVDEMDSKARYIDLVNTARKRCADMSYDDLDLHISGLMDEMECLKAKLFTAKAVQSEKLEAMDDAERQKRRRVKVVLSSPIPKEQGGASSKRDEPDTEKQQTINSIIKDHKKSAAEAAAIYGLMKKNKLSVTQAIMLLED